MQPIFIVAGVVVAIVAFFIIRDILRIERKFNPKAQLEDNPRNARAMVRLADKALESGRTDEGIGLLLDAARIQHEDGMHLKARSLFDRVLEAQPANQAAKDGKAAVERDLGLDS